MSGQSLGWMKMSVWMVDVHHHPWLGYLLYSSLYLGPVTTSGKWNVGRSDVPRFQPGLEKTLLCHPIPSLYSDSQLVAENPVKDCKFSVVWLYLKPEEYRSPNCHLDGSRPSPKGVIYQEPHISLECIILFDFVIFCKALIPS